jgi:hypothetical protein
MLWSLRRGVKPSPEKISRNDATLATATKG